MQLIRRSQSGDREAFEELVTGYRDVLTRTAYLAARDHHVVPDILQETLIQIWRDLPAYRPHGSFKAWVLKILHNQASRQYRKKRVETVPLDGASNVTSDMGNPLEAVAREEAAGHLRAALKTLNHDHREVLVLRYYADLTVPESAKVLGCRPGTVKSRLSRALDKLEAGLVSESFAE